MLKPDRKHLLTLLIAILLQTSPLIAQRRVTAPKKPASPAPQVRTPTPEPVPTFDTLLSADNYRIYGEVRSVGQFVRSPGLNDLLNPLIKLAGSPKEFRTVLKWLNEHGDALAGSRLLVASWSAKPKLPNVLIAIEFPSVEEAQKFDPQLRRLMPALMPTPAPTPTPEAGQNKSPVPPPVASLEADRLPYHIKQAGTLVLLSDQPFTFRSLAPPGSKPLAEDQNFATARNRFASESIFLYVDLKSIEKEERERREKYEAEELLRIENEAANPPKPEEVTAEMVTPNEPSPIQSPPPEPDVSPQPSASLGAVVVQPAPEPQLTNNSAVAAVPAASPEPEVINPAMLSLGSLLFDGPTTWPEAIGAAIAFEGDSYIVRALILNADENRSSAIPFIPQFISGPPLLPASPGVFPADTDLLVTFSLDYPQIYEATVKAFANAQELAKKHSARGSNNQPVVNREPESPFAVYEKKMGIKIKDDLLPLLGNELAFALPAKPAVPVAASPGLSPEVTGPNTKPTSPPAPDANPIIAISVKDKEALRKLIPKIIEALGVKGANMFAQTEKRDDTEIVSYANLFSYAFVGDFLVLSPDPAATRHVVDSYLSNDTLSSNSHFRNFTRWQPRQVLGQAYLAPDLMQKYTSMLIFGASPDHKVLDFLNGLNPIIDPVTYALANEGSGPLHELHVPKNLLLMWIANMSKASTDAQPGINEGVAQSELRTVHSAEMVFKDSTGKGQFGRLEELVSEDLISKEMITDRYGYRVEITLTADKYEATAVPLTYGQTGRLSFFIDESGVLRGGDHGGGPATAADNPVD